MLSIAQFYNLMGVSKFPPALPGCSAGLLVPCHAGASNFFTTEHTEITKKIFLFSVRYLYGLCAVSVNFQFLRIHKRYHRWKGR